MKSLNWSYGVFLTCSLMFASTLWGSTDVGFENITPMYDTVAVVADTDPPMIPAATIDVAACGHWGSGLMYATHFLVDKSIEPAPISYCRYQYKPMAKPAKAPIPT